MAGDSTRFLPAVSAVQICPPIAVFICANGSEVEHRLAKARAAGSNPVSRSLFLKKANTIGLSPRGKAQHFDCCIRRFKSYQPSSLEMAIYLFY